MKWQVLMVSLAAVLAIVLGGERWHARITAHSAFSKNATNGHWVLLYGDQEGVKALRESSSSPEPLHGYEKLPQYNTGGFDVTPDLSRMAFIDMSDYSDPQLRVVSARHVDRPVTVASAAPGHQMQCPLFDTDGAVLYLETGTSRAWEMHRLAVPAGSSAKSSHPTTVSWPSPIDPNDCPERSIDGSVFAWMGTDAQIHVARRDPGGNFSPEVKIRGADFELAPDGSFVVTFDGTNLVAIDTTSLARHTIAANVKGSRVIAISPDGTWVAASTTGSYGSGGWTAFRIRDGAEVPLSVAGNSYYFGYDTRRKVWLAK